MGEVKNKNSLIMSETEKLENSTLSTEEQISTETIIDRIQEIEDPTEKANTLRNFLFDVEEIQDENEREEKRKNLRKLLQSNQFLLRDTFDTLLKNEEYEDILRLIDLEYVDIVRGQDHHYFNFTVKNDFCGIKSDSFIFEYAKRTQDRNFIRNSLPYITDENVLDRIIKNTKQCFPSLKEFEHNEIRYYARIYFNALVQEPVIEAVYPLKEEVKNKFILGISEEENKLHILFSNTSDLTFHKDILRESEITFENFTISGGIVTLEEYSEGIEIKFWGKSGDFGRYNHRVLEKFKEKILESLKETLSNENITLVIEPSK
jgi:hypothetical protein